MKTNLCVITKLDGVVLARDAADKVVRLEGNYYFHPEQVQDERLDTSDREYNCPQKGTCVWVDYKSNRGFINDSCWIYPRPRPGFEHIAGRYGFYPESDIYRVAECD